MDIDSLIEEGVLVSGPWIRWLYLENSADFKSCELDLYFYDESTDTDFQEEMTISGVKGAKTTDFYHKIAYGMKLKQQVINLSTRYQIPSELTFLMPRTQNNLIQIIKKINLQPLLFQDSKDIPSDYIDKVKEFGKNIENYLDGSLFGEKKFDFYKRKFLKKFEKLIDNYSPGTYFGYLPVLFLLLVLFWDLYH